MKQLKKLNKKQSGQAILEYIIIIALVAVAALTVLGLFGDRIRQLIAGSANAIGSQEASQAAGDNGDSLKGLRQMDSNGPSDVNF